MDVGLSEQKKKPRRHPGVPVSQPANLDGDTTLCELGGGNAVGGQGARGQGKIQRQRAHHIRSAGSRRHTHHGNSGSMVNAPTMMVGARLKGQKDVKLPENGLGRSPPPQGLKERGNQLERGVMQKGRWRQSPAP